MSELYNDAQYTAMAWNATMLKSGPDRNTSIPYNRKHQIRQFNSNVYQSMDFYLGKESGKKDKRIKTRHPQWMFKIDL